MTFQISWTQNCDLVTRNLSNQLNGESKLIEKSEYEKISEISEQFIEFTQMTELKLTEKYPAIFKLKDSCYIFPANPNNGIGIETDELKACMNKVQTKEYSDYQFEGVYCNNALIRVTGYEHWGYLSVDLQNRLTCFTMGKPLTSNGETAISYSNYYGEEEIALTDLKSKKQYIIGIEGWTTVESKILKNVYYLKLESHAVNKCEKEITYLKINLKT